MWRTAALLVLSILLCSCGWQLRGEADLPASLRTLQLVAQDNNSPLIRGLRRALGTAGVSVVSDRDDVNRLVLGREVTKTRSVSVDRNGRPVEREMRISLEAEIQDAAGERLYGPFEVAADKLYRFDSNSVIATEDEERRIRSELQESLKRQLLRALEAAGRRLEAATTG